MQPGQARPQLPGFEYDPVNDRYYRTNASLASRSTPIQREQSERRKASAQREALERLARRVQNSRPTFNTVGPVDATRVFLDRSMNIVELGDATVAFPDVESNQYYVMERNELRLISLTRSTIERLPISIDGQLRGSCPAPGLAYWRHPSALVFSSFVSSSPYTRFKFLKSSQSYPRHHYLERHAGACAFFKHDPTAIISEYGTRRLISLDMNTALQREVRVSLGKQSIRSLAAEENSRLCALSLTGGKIVCIDAFVDPYKEHCSLRLGEPYSAKRLYFSHHSIYAVTDHSPIFLFDKRFQEPSLLMDFTCFAPDLKHLDVDYQVDLENSLILGSTENGGLLAWDLRKPALPIQLLTLDKPVLSLTLTPDLDHGLTLILRKATS